ncbi:MAG: periplasmic sensor signal transduction histidine kinase, partial [bacterium]|nr:periplasmic sensor signal transduction histidine kinase [bacterium]
MTTRTGPPRPRRRLLLTIYLVGVAQLAVAGVAIFVMQTLFQNALWRLLPVWDKAALDSYAEFFDLPEALARALPKLNDVDLTYYRMDGQVVASTRPAIPPLGADELRRLSQSPVLLFPTMGPVPITAAPVLRDGKMVGYGLVHRRPPPGLPWARHAGLSPPVPHGPPLAATSLRPAARPPLPPSQMPIVIACALFGSAVISILFARSLARPLEKLAEAAQAFGAGDHQARAHIHRDDELGAVALAFDEMAEQVNALLSAQREFLANVSHELRTPLARIRVALDL